MTADSGMTAGSGVTAGSGMGASNRTTAGSGVTADSGTTLDSGVTAETGAAADNRMTTGSGVTADNRATVDSGVTADYRMTADSGVTADYRATVDGGVTADNRGTADSGVTAGGGVRDGDGEGVGGGVGAEAVLGAVLDALRQAFLGEDGRPVEVEVRHLEPAEAAGLVPDGAVRPVVVVPDDAAVARLLAGCEVTGAVVVRDESDCVLMSTGAPLDHRHRAVIAGVQAAAAALAGTISRLRSEAAVVDALHSVGRRLTAQLDIGRLVQEATDAATTATGAAFGAFFYNLINEFGESYTLYTLSGVPREAFSRFPMPRNTEVFEPTFSGAGTTRSDNIRADPRFGHNEPYYGMPEGHLPVCSYLAVSVISPTTGEVLGGFFFGHPEPGQFTGRHEHLAEGIAAYTAIALDNARLYQRERNMARELASSMLPAAPEIPGLRIVTRYLPAVTGSKVGGDWFDVIRLRSGGTAFVIGDVVGHGVTAATVMGQIRTAIRSYALLELRPSELLRNVSQLTESLSEPSFITCFYAVHSPADDVLTFANAGHLPAVLVHPDGTVEQIGEALAQPLGVGSEFPEATAPFPPGTDLMLYTDGLVESRTRDLTLSMKWVLDAVGSLRTDPDTEAACDRLIEELTHGGHDDDVALIHVHHREEGRS